MNTKVYVGDLGANGNKLELEKEFERFGTLKSVWVARNPPGFAFVEFEDPRDAEEAVRELDGQTVGNVRIRVELAKNKGSGGGGGGGGGRRNDRRGPPPSNRGYRGDRRGSPPRRRSRSPYRRRSRSPSPWRSGSPRYNRSPYYNKRSRSRSPYYDHRRSRSPPYRRSPGPRDDRRMDNSRSPSPR